MCLCVSMCVCRSSCHWYDLTFRVAIEGIFTNSKVHRKWTPSDADSADGNWVRANVCMCCANWPVACRLCVGDGGGGCGGGDGGLCPAGERCLFAVCRLERSAAWVKLKVRIDGTNAWSGRVVSALTKT